jgi:hypothetical protein
VHSHFYDDRKEAAWEIFHAGFLLVGRTPGGEPLYEILHKINSKLIAQDIVLHPQNFQINLALAGIELWIPEIFRRECQVKPLSP